ncbi:MULTISPECIES: metal/formaldehyde-sensitive transcriptional repressor [Ancylobacter]|uniref:Metal/formaldehyde-sensitive transcriptional repressor n=1 Tax=Ancylobacter radicis TaxID=2836179 RepID=A0ABS5R6J4_9HYPH|nr:MULTISPECIES: metal/formaldehyde-sensitive transcriptional repressor [Ancylobacter]MBS9477291.1 metal/formaldehyde-sensitive transcriptional repressor [Ancylobacter radicis]WGD31347.1 metal/formaldehyde-sensitive transcriptional repressor [Ancylobacter sp. WKF20]
MPHSPDDKKRALTRLRRIRGQAEALERAVEAGTDCRPLLQQIAALRGAVGGLMAEVLESHLRETFGPGAPGHQPGPFDGELDEITTILRTYLK